MFYRLGNCSVQKPPILFVFSGGANHSWLSSDQYARFLPQVSFLGPKLLKLSSCAVPLLSILLRVVDFGNTQNHEITCINFSNTQKQSLLAENNIKFRECYHFCRNCAIAPAVGRFVCSSLPSLAPGTRHRAPGSCIWITTLGNGHVPGTLGKNTVRNKSFQRDRLLKAYFGL